MTFLRYGGEIRIKTNGTTDIYVEEVLTDIVKEMVIKSCEVVVKNTAGNRREMMSILWRAMERAARGELTVACSDLFDLLYAIETLQEPEEDENDEPV